MYIERVDYADDDAFDLTCKRVGKKEVEITLMPMKITFCVLYERAREVFRVFVKQFNQSAPLQERPKAGICAAKSGMSDDELLKALGWGK